MSDIDFVTRADRLTGFRRARIVEVPGPKSVAEALAKDATARRIMAKGVTLEDGMLVGSRLNLNVLKSQGIAVNTIHAATNKTGYRCNKGFFNGSVLAYDAVVQLRHCYFNAHQVGRQKIAAGASAKFPMASCDGELDLVSPVRTDGLAVMFNPKRERLFLAENGWPIHYAEHATVIGHRVYVRGEVRFYTSLSAPASAGDSPCAAIFPDELVRDSHVA